MNIDRHYTSNTYYNYHKPVVKHQNVKHQNVKHQPVKHQQEQVPPDLLQEVQVLAASIEYRLNTIYNLLHAEQDSQVN